MSSISLDFFLIGNILFFHTATKTAGEKGNEFEYALRNFCELTGSPGNNLTPSGPCRYDSSLGKLYFVMHFMLKQNCGTRKDFISTSFWNREHIVDAVKYSMILIQVS